MSSRQILITLSGAAVIMAVVGAVLFLRYGEAAAGDPRRVAVAPFDLPDDPGALAPLRVGLATGLTDRFVASGEFDAVPQREVEQIWRARTTPIIAAVELARRTAAGLALYGRVDREAADTVTIRAAVIDAYSAVGMFEVAVRLPAGVEVAQAADTLTALLLARLRAP